MGSAASKSARSAAGAASRRQYPKQPSTLPKGSRSSAPAAGGNAPTPTPAPSPSASSQAHSHGPVYHSKETPSSFRSNGIDLDGRDPDFAASLRSIGPVNPTPTLSHSSTFNRPTSGQTAFPQATNPALLVFAARQRITKAAEEEAEQVGSPDYAGRQFLDALTIQQALSMRDQQGLSSAEIEDTLRLTKGVMGRLGADGVVSRIASLG